MTETTGNAESWFKFRSSLIWLIHFEESAYFWLSVGKNIFCSKKLLTLQLKDRADVASRREKECNQRGNARRKKRMNLRLHPPEDQKFIRT